MAQPSYTISNTAGGDARTYRLTSDATMTIGALRHADRLEDSTCGGVVFSGDGAEQAARDYADTLTSRAYADGDTEYVADWKLYYRA